MPATLDETYDRNFCNIDPIYKSEVLHFLQWLVSSQRPLSLYEIAEVVAFNIDNKNQFNRENRKRHLHHLFRLSSR